MIIVGAFGFGQPWGPGTGRGLGAAYVYLKPRDSNFQTTSTFTKIIQASDVNESDYFTNTGARGISIPSSGGVFVIGSVYHDTGGNVDQGAAYVYESSYGGALEVSGDIRGSFTGDFVGLGAAIAEIKALRAEINILENPWEIIMSSEYKKSGHTAAKDEARWGYPGRDKDNYSYHFHNIEGFGDNTAANNGTGTNAHARTRFGDGNGLYRAFFNKRNITEIALVDGSSHRGLFYPETCRRYIIYRLNGSTGDETLYEIIKRLDTYNLNNLNWTNNDTVFNGPSVTNFTAGVNAGSGTAYKWSNGVESSPGHYVGRGIPTKFAIWGVNQWGDNDTQVLAAYRPHLEDGSQGGGQSQKRDNWRGVDPKETLWSYWGSDWNSNSQTQTLSKHVESPPGTADNALWNVQTPYVYSNNGGTDENNQRTYLIARSG